MVEQRLIDANVLKLDLPTETPEDECITDAVCRIIDKQPTIDVVNVVRCKDCEWYNIHEELCTIDYLTCEPTFYCANGIARNNDKIKSN